MSWPEYRAARQLLAEERLGKRVREVKAEEDDEFAAARRALRKG